MKAHKDITLADLGLTTKEMELLARGAAKYLRCDDVADFTDTKSPKKKGLYARRPLAS